MRAWARASLVSRTTSATTSGAGGSAGFWTLIRLTRVTAAGWPGPLRTWTRTKRVAPRLGARHRSTTCPRAVVRRHRGVLHRAVLDVRTWSRTRRAWRLPFVTTRTRIRWVVAGATETGVVDHARTTVLAEAAEALWPAPTRTGTGASSATTRPAASRRTHERDIMTRPCPTARRGTGETR